MLNLMFGLYLYGERDKLEHLLNEGNNARLIYFNFYEKF